jgi:hypothetical protein
MELKKNNFGDNLVFLRNDINKKLIIEVGDKAKLYIEDIPEKRNEIDAVITEIIGNNYVGKIVNCSMVGGKLELGKIVTFEKENIFYCEKH